MRKLIYLAVWLLAGGVGMADGLNTPTSTGWFHIYNGTDVDWTIDPGDGAAVLIVQRGGVYDGGFPSGVYNLQCDAQSFVIQLLEHHKMIITLRGATGNYQADIYQDVNEREAYRSTFLSGVQNGAVIGGMLFAMYAVRWALRIINDSGMED